MLKYIKILHDVNFSGTILWVPSFPCHTLCFLNCPLSQGLRFEMHSFTETRSPKLTEVLAMFPAWKCSPPTCSMALPGTSELQLSNDLL